MTKRFDFAVTKDGERLDAFLALRQSTVSRSRIQRLIEGGQVTVDGRPSKPSLRVVTGQTVVLELPDPTPTRLRPQQIPLSVVHEDEGIIVIDKPAGMAVHPAPGNEDCTLANAILAHSPDLEGIGGELRPGIVHRLDKDTSGLIVVAKNERAHANLSEQFKQRTVKKVYLGLVHGHLSPPEAIIEAPLGRHPHDRQKMAIVKKGRPASTRYRVDRVFRQASLVQVRTQTGRTHQIRVHLTSIGHPIVGDSIYGRADPELDRHFLHAHDLGFRHPETGKDIEFQSGLPIELRSYIDDLQPV